MAEQSEPDTLRAPRGWHTFAVVLSVASLVYVGFQAFDLFAHGGLGSVRISMAGMALACALALLNFALLGMVYARLVAAFGGVVGQGRAHGLFLASQIAKYIPGRVWPVLIQKALSGGKLSLRRSVAINLLIMYAALVVLALSWVMVVVRLQTNGWLQSIAISAVLSVVLACAPPVGISVARRLRLPEWISALGAAYARPGTEIAFNAIMIWLLTLSTVGAWMAFYRYGVNMDEDQTLHLTAISCASWLAGLASVLPGGFGIREAAFIMLGKGQGTAQGVAATLALVSRAWLVVTDLMASAIGFAALRRWRS